MLAKTRNGAVSAANVNMFHQQAAHMDVHARVVARLCGCAVVRLGVWLCGCVVLWPRGCTAVWLCHCVVCRAACSVAMCWLWGGIGR